MVPIPSGRNDERVRKKKTKGKAWCCYTKKQKSVITSYLPIY